jgi:predicted nucleic acid-binding protein
MPFYIRVTSLINLVHCITQTEEPELLIDERLGRREAVRLGLSITGVLGVLLIAKNRGLISKVQPIIDALILQANFRISRQLYEEVLQTANELD